MSKKKKGTSLRDISSTRGTIKKCNYKYTISKARHKLLNNSVLIQELNYERKKESHLESVLKKYKTFNMTLIKPNSNYPSSCNIQNENKKAERELLDKTIDLCTDDESKSEGGQISMESSDLSDNPEIIIDFCKNVRDENDVIIVQEKCVKTPENCCVKDATLIDLCDDSEIATESNNSSSSKDEIFVVESVDKIPWINPSSEKFNQLIKYYISGNKKFRRQKKKRHLKTLKLNQGNFTNRSQINYINEIQYNNLQPPYEASRVGENVYMNSPVALPSCGLRPIIIDGSNVAIGNNKNHQFSCKKLEICIKFFKERGHKVTAFVPQFRTLHNKSDDPELLNKLVKSGDVILTPSKRVEGKSIVPYDDRFIVQTAVLKGGIIVTRDNYRDLLVENPAWAETINYRTLPYTWVDDVLMFPNDPLGEYGPSLNEFLRFN